MTCYMYMYTMHDARDKDRSFNDPAPLKEQLPSAGPRHGFYAQLCHEEVSFGER